MAWRDCPRCGGPTEGASECPHCGVDPWRYRAYLETIALPPPLPLPPEPPRGPVPAGLWARAGAFGLDYLLVMLAQLGWAFVARLVWGVGVYDSRVFTAALTAFPFACGGAYMALSHWLWGQTLGKMAVGLRVEGRDGGPPGLAAAVGRFLLVALSLAALGLPFLLGAVRPDRRAPHDLATGTRVVRAVREPDAILDASDAAVAAP